MKKNKSFTIVEIMVAMTIFTLVVGGSIVLIQQTLLMVSYAKNKLVAAYLSQEAIELIRNIRDTNWIRQMNGENVAWWEGLTNEQWISGNPQQKKYYISYNDPVLRTTTRNADCSLSQCQPLCCYSYGPYFYLDSNGGYSYNVDCSTNPKPTGCTTFRRWIWIGRRPWTGGVNDPIEIHVHVWWQERGRTKAYFITTKVILYNWYGKDI